MERTVTVVEEHPGVTAPIIDLGVDVMNVSEMEQGKDFGRSNRPTSLIATEWRPEVKAFTLVVNHVQAFEAVDNGSDPVLVDVSFGIPHSFVRIEVGDLDKLVHVWVDHLDQRKFVKTHADHSSNLFL
jgi:hypothetical protein